MLLTPVQRYTRCQHSLGGNYFNFQALGQKEREGKGREDLALKMQTYKATKGATKCSLWPPLLPRLLLRSELGECVGVQAHTAGPPQVGGQLLGLRLLGQHTPFSQPACSAIVCKPHHCKCPEALWRQWINTDLSLSEKESYMFQVKEISQTLTKGILHMRKSRLRAVKWLV